VCEYEVNWVTNNKVIRQKTKLLTQFFMKFSWKNLANKIVHN